MAQISLYLPDAEMDKLRSEAAEEGISISSYAREVLSARDTKGRRNWENGWPPGYFDLFGSSPDFPSVVDLPPEPVSSW